MNGFELFLYYKRLSYFSNFKALWSIKLQVEQGEWELGRGTLYLLFTKTEGKKINVYILKRHTFESVFISDGSTNLRVNMKKY